MLENFRWPWVQQLSVFQEDLFRYNSFMSFANALVVKLNEVIQRTHDYEDAIVQTRDEVQQLFEDIQAERVRLEADLQGWKTSLEQELWDELWGQTDWLIDTVRHQVYNDLQPTISGWMDELRGQAQSDRIMFEDQYTAFYGSISTLFSALQSQVTSDIAAMRATLDSLTSLDWGNIENTLTQVQLIVDNMGDLPQQLINMRGSISDMEDSITALSGEITRLDGLIVDVKNDIHRLETSLAIVDESAELRDAVLDVGVSTRTLGQWDDYFLTGFELGGGSQSAAVRLPIVQELVPWIEPAQIDEVMQECEVRTAGFTGLGVFNLYARQIRSVNQFLPASQDNNKRGTNASWGPATSSPAHFSQNAMEQKYVQTDEFAGWVTVDTKPAFSTGNMLAVRVTVAPRFLDGANQVGGSPETTFFNRKAARPGWSIHFRVLVQNGSGGAITYSPWRNLTDPMTPYRPLGVDVSFRDGSGISGAHLLVPVEGLTNIIGNSYKVAIEIGTASSASAVTEVFESRVMQLNPTYYNQPPNTAYFMGSFGFNRMNDSVSANWLEYNAQTMFALEKRVDGLYIAHHNQFDLNWQTPYYTRVFYSYTTPAGVRTNAVAHPIITRMHLRQYQA